jgi:hypothetical protein
MIFLVVFIGGTIGSTLSDGVIDVSNVATYKLFELSEKTIKIINKSRLI